MRNAFADEITKLAKNDQRIVLLTGDIGNKLFDQFKEENNGTFLNCGIAEANMMGVASGLALTGLRPVVYTITPFTTTRCFEQIRVDVCYHNVPVIIVGTGSGLSYASLGPTHHSLEDFAIFRAIPNITILAPADEVELRQCLSAALKMSGPIYIRIGKKGEEVVSKKEKSFKIGKSINLKKGKDICLIGAGTVMPMVLEAAKILEKKGLSSRVESFHTIKPIDKETLKEVFSSFKLIGVIEEHSKIGGLFGAIAEWTLKHKISNVRVLNFGTDDYFMHDIGSQTYAREQYGLTSKNISSSIFKTFSNL